MDVTAVVALLGFAITVVATTAAGVFTFIKYIQGSFERVHNRLDDHWRDHDQKHDKLDERIDGIDLRVGKLEGKNDA